MNLTFQRLFRALAALVFPLGGLAGTFYISLTGTGTGSASDPAGVSSINSLIQNNEEADLRFAPGVYVLSQGISRSWTSLDANGNPIYTNKKVALIGTNPGRNSTTATVFKFADNLHTDSGGDDAWRDVKMLDMSKDPNFEQLVIENIVFDGNFTKQSQVVGPHFREGYKSAAVMAQAKSGRITNCIIRDFGAQGMMPASSGVAAGVEAFPVLIMVPESTFAPDSWPKLPATPQDARWLIEGNEIYGLKFPYSGYATAIMVAPLFNLPLPTTAPVQNNRVALVRGNVVRDVPIALGIAGTTSSWSGRVRFDGNVVLNCGVGFNGDTYSIREFDLQKNLFMDVGGLGYYGQANVSQTAIPPHDYLNVIDNTVRLRGSTNFLTYDDYYRTNHIQQTGANGVPTVFYEGAVSEPTLPLARLQKTFPAGLTLQGRAGHVIFTGNRFSTWDAGRFVGVAPLPAAPEDSQWRPLFVVEPWTQYSEQHFKRSRAYASDVIAADTKISGRPFDFAEFSTLNDGGGAPISILTTSAAPNHTSLRSALSATPAQVTPVGRLGRMGPIFDGTGKNLVGAVEVTITKLTYTTGANGKLSVSVRVAEQRVQPANSADYSVVRPGGTEKVRLQFYGDLPNAWQGNPQTYQLAADAWGYAHFVIPAANLESFTGVLAVRAWVPTANTSGAQATGNFVALASYSSSLEPSNPPSPPADNGTTSTAIFNELTSAWAEAVVPVGQTVALTALPDVANEKSASRAKLVLTRTGSTAAALAVRISLPVNSPAGTPFTRRAIYGSSGSADYFFDWSSAAYLASVPVEANRPVTGTTGKVSVLPTDTADGYVVFPANSDRIIVDVVPRTDEVFERETAYVQLGDPVATGPYPNEPYRVVQPKDVAVILYDGPTWTLVELTSMVYDTYLATYKQATAALAWALNQETNPKVAGWAQLPAVYGQAAYQKLGWWNSATANYINELSLVPALDGNGLPIDRWYGLSTTTPTLVGQFNNRAYKWLIGGSGSYPNVQPPIPDQSPPGLPPTVYFQTAGGSAIFGVSVNNTYMAGKATPTTPGAFARPMRWENGNPVDLVGSSPSFTSGEARGVDSTGTTVGHVNLNYSKRAFRVASGAIGPASILNKYRYPCLTGNCSASEDLWNSWAYGIAPKVNGTSTVDNYTVGSSTTLKLDTYNTLDPNDDRWIQSHEEAAVCWDSNGTPILIGENYLPPIRSRALAINDSGEIVGWSGNTAGSTEWTGNGTVISSAFVCRAVRMPPVSLNDKHFVHGLVGWNLAVASGINNQGWIVGIGTKGGQTRGFLLRQLSN